MDQKEFVVANEIEAHVPDLARSLGADTRTVTRCADILAELFLLRRLPPWHANVGKRLTKSPRICLRDSGLVHGLLGLSSLEDLLAHPIAGASWEGFVIENLLAIAPDGTQPYYYRTSGGAEIDLLLQLPGGALWAVEIKRSSAPAPSRGFYEACADLQPAWRVLVHTGGEIFPLRDGIEAVPFPLLARQLAAANR